jgi:hypothetical protein
MKIALCFRGMASGMSKGTKVMAFQKTHQETWSSLDNLIQGNDFDVFCHTWSIDRKNDINELYKPKKILAEKQKIFDKNYVLGMDNNSQNFKDKKVWAPQLCLSQIYSIKKTIDLKNQYEKENNFVYDAVFILRYDQYFYKKYDYFTLQNDKNIVHPFPPRWHQNATRSKYPYMKRKTWDTWWAGSNSSIQKIADSFDAISRSNYEIKGMHHLWDYYFSTLKKDLSSVNIIQYPFEISSLFKNRKANRSIASYASYCAKHQLVKAYEKKLNACTNGESLLEFTKRMVGKNE